MYSDFLGNGAFNQYDDDEPRRRWPWMAAVGAVVALAAGTVFWVSTHNSSASKRTVAPVAAPLVESVPLTPVLSTTAVLAAPTTASTSTSTTATTTVPQIPAPAPSTGAGRSTTATTATAATVAVPASTASTNSTTVAAPATEATSPVVAAGTPYPTLPDGEPQPVVVIFDTSTITLTGEVPSKAAVDRLSSLVLANSQTPAVVVNNLIINPGVPLSVGVRVIELNSARFPTASSTVLPAHAKELDRVANVMKALQGVSVLVIGHADQRGNDETNLAISASRAQAVVNYLIYVGISPSRLSSRGVGDSDLLTQQSDAVSLTLNRRTEFVFYGLLTA